MADLLAAPRSGHQAGAATRTGAAADVADVDVRRLDSQHGTMNQAREGLQKVGGSVACMQPATTCRATCVDHMCGGEKTDRMCRAGQNSMQDTTLSSRSTGSVPTLYNNNIHPDKAHYVQPSPTPPSGSTLLYSAATGRPNNRSQHPFGASQPPHLLNMAISFPPFRGALHLHTARTAACRPHSRSVRQLRPVGGRAPGES